MHLSSKIKNEQIQIAFIKANKKLTDSDCIYQQNKRLTYSVCINQIKCYVFPKWKSISSHFKSNLHKHEPKLG